MADRVDPLDGGIACLPEFPGPGRDVVFGVIGYNYDWINPMRRFALLAIACYLVAACNAPSQTATSKLPPFPQLTSTPYPITVIADLAYARALNVDGSDLLLDLYAPTAPGTYPVVIHAHGAPGSKNNDGSVWFGKTLAADGFVVLVANWDSFDPRQTGWQDNGRRLRAAGEGAACLLSFASTETTKMGGDPHRLIWTGVSAGGWLGFWAVLASPDSVQAWDDFAAANGGPPPQYACDSLSSAPQLYAVVESSGVFAIPAITEIDNPPLWEFLTHHYRVGSNPDTIIRMLHGKRDTSVSLESVTAFYQQLLEAGYDATLTELPGGHSGYLDQLIEAVLSVVVD
jgi:poly(3-hydroxybutyrate) depolymerase